MGEHAERIANTVYWETGSETASSWAGLRIAETRAGFGLYNEISKAKAVLDEGDEAAGTKPDAAACQADGLTGGGGDG